MAYRVEIGPRADAQLAGLDPIIGASVERKIFWLSENASALVHRRLAGMPDDLAALCKLRVGDWRILYWVYHSE
jgi:mRNA-degrading endonuclease RelE of RelBE toxin-antitoxin system